LAAALAERLLFLRAVRNSSSSRYITGAYQVAIDMPFFWLIVFSDLHIEVTVRRFDSGKPAA
jgi:hypothetical protein